MMKKLVALILAVVMVMAMGSVAFATGASNTYSGSDQSEAISVKGGTTIPLTKSIIFFNLNDNSDVYEPNITFSYDVVSQPVTDSSVTVTDNKNPANIAYVHAGPADGVTGTTISFSSSNAKKAGPDGIEVEESSILTVDLSKFSAPGIYRYKITESVSSPSGSDDNARVQAAGLTARDASYIDTRYLDVYIHYNASNQLEMYGAVIFVSTESTGSGSGTDDIDTSTEKTTGFQPGVKDNGTTPDYKNDKNVDKYTTYNFTVEKAVTGLGDVNHEFPFYVSVANSISGAKISYAKDDTETFSSGNTYDNAAGTVVLGDAAFQIGAANKDSSLKLKDKQKITLIGVPSSQSAKLAVEVTEYNDTVDQYVPTASAQKGSPLMNSTSVAKGAAMTASTGSDKINSFDIVTNDVAAQSLKITNDLPEISVTGVVMRVAPYMLILAAGMVLVLISRRRKAEEE